MKLGCNERLGSLPVGPGLYGMSSLPTGPGLFGLSGLGGLTQLGTDTNGNALYIADASTDTSGLYEVGSLADGTAIFSDSPNASAAGVTGGVPTTGQAAQTNTSLWSGFANMLTAGAQAYTTKQILDTNITRAKAGLPPISSASVAPTVNVGMAPATQQLVTFGLLGLGAVVLFSMMRR